MSIRVLMAGGVLAALPLPLIAQSGSPDDIYVLSDASHEIYEFERNTPWNHVPGAYMGSLVSPYEHVFSNTGQLLSNSPYIGAVAGAAQDFFVGGFAGLQQIDSTTGARKKTVGVGERIGPALAPNGNVVVGGPTGVEEFDSNTGNFVRTVNGVGDGENLFAFRQDEMLVASWSNAGFGIRRYDFLTGLSSGATIPIPIGPQEIGIGPDGALYATAQYEGAGIGGLYRYDFDAGDWTRFIDTTGLPGGGPHGFTFDPDSHDIYMAFSTGEIHRFDVSGAYLNQINFVPTKLTDVLFKHAVPEPATCGLLGVVAIVAFRRR